MVLPRYSKSLHSAENDPKNMPHYANLYYARTWKIALVQIPHYARTYCMYISTTPIVLTD